MFFALTNSDIIEIGKKALENAEWISYVKDYPNLRGVFDEKWGSPADPSKQIQTFLKQFLTEDQYVALAEICNSSSDTIFVLNETATPESISHAKEVFKEYFETTGISNQEFESLLNKLLSEKILIMIRDLEIPMDEYDHSRFVQTFHDLLSGIHNRGIDELYRTELLFYTREFVDFYLKHVKALSRADIFNLCKKIGDTIVKELTPPIYFGKRIFDILGVLFYTVPRGGLEVLGIFLYANNINKDVVPIYSCIYFPVDIIIKKLEKMKAQGIDEDEINKIIEWLQEFGTNVEEVPVFGTEVGHEEITYIFLIDDYFASGHHVRKHFKQVPIQKIKAISITKRRDLKYLKEASHSSVYNFSKVLTTSYYGILTEDVKVIYELFPEIKRVLKSEIEKIDTKNIRKEIFYEYFGGVNININREWIDNVTITCVFPHAIADGKTEALLRLLYGDRFKHGIRERLSFLSNIASLIKKIKNA